MVESIVKWVLLFRFLSLISLPIVFAILLAHIDGVNRSVFLIYLFLLYIHKI